MPPARRRVNATPCSTPDGSASARTASTGRRASQGTRSSRCGTTSSSIARWRRSGSVTAPGQRAASVTSRARKEKGCRCKSARAVWYGRRKRRLKPTASRDAPAAAAAMTSRASRGRGGERLLHQHVAARLDRGQRQSGMGAGRRGDQHGLGPHPAQQLAQARLDRHPVKGLAGPAAADRVGLHGPDQPDLRAAPDRRQMEALDDPAAAQDREGQRRGRQPPCRSPVISLARAPIRRRSAFRRMKPSASFWS